MAKVKTRRKPPKKSLKTAKKEKTKREKKTVQRD
jgi:hypothetical protein